MGWKLHALSLVLAAIAYVLYDGAVFRKIEPHGQCRHVSGLPGIEDLAQAGEYLVLVSDNRTWTRAKNEHEEAAAMSASGPGRLALWSVRDGAACAAGGACTPFTPLTIDAISYVTESKLEPNNNNTTFPQPLTHFHPHGLSVHSTSDNISRIFVVNHIPYADSIEVFRWSPLNKSNLIHERTVRHAVIKSSNDIHAVSPTAFYLTRDLFYARNTGFPSLVEQFLRMPWGSVSYCQFESDLEAAPTCRVVASGLRMPNGIAGSHDGKYIYVVESLGRAMIAFKRDLDGNLTEEFRVPIDSACDNAFVDAHGAVLSGCHPKPLSFLLHSRDFENHAPSQVIRFNVTDRTTSELFLSHGDDLSASSAAACVDNTLFISPVFVDGFLVCADLC